jgi:AcrR family transcriptional regulator
VMNDMSPIAKSAMPSGERSPASRSSYASRHDRRRLETRARLLRALMKLLARKSLPDIAIHEITEVADVGGGTFYNHFTDRASIHDAMMTELVGGWSDIVGGAAPIGHDAAETLALRMRLYIIRAGLDRDWADYVVANAFKEMLAQSPIWQRTHDLIDHGRKQGRFSHPEPSLATRAICSLSVATIQAVAGDPLKAAAEARTATAFALTLLGVSPADCERLTAVPLPAAPWDDSSLVRRAHNARLATQSS